MRCFEPRLWTLLALLAGLAVLAGCESDSTAPDDDLPPLSQEDAASQASIMSMMVHRIGPELVTFEPDLAKDTYTYTFGEGEDVQGVLYFDFRMGGPDGLEAPYDEATWGSMETAQGAPLTVLNPTGPDLELTCAITGDIDQEAETADIYGFGTFTAGEYSSTWAIFGVHVANTGYPEAGSVEFTAGEHVITVTYDGDAVAEVSVDGEVVGTVDLDTGVFTEVVEE